MACAESPQTTRSRIAEQLCFALYSASHAVIAYYRPMLDALDLTYPQYLSMLTLWEHGPLTVKELGGFLRLDSGTLSPLLKRLEQRGFVERKRSDADERSVEISLTERGVALRHEAAGVPAVIQNAMALDDEQLAVLRQQLRDLSDSIRAAPRPSLPGPI